MALEAGQPEQSGHVGASATLLEEVKRKSFPLPHGSDRNPKLISDAGRHVSCVLQHVSGSCCQFDRSIIKTKSKISYGNQLDLILFMPTFLLNKCFRQIMKPSNERDSLF